MSHSPNQTPNIQQIIDLVKSTKDLIENREMAGHVK